MVEPVEALHRKYPNKPDWQVSVFVDLVVHLTFEAVAQDYLQVVPDDYSELPLEEVSAQFSHFPVLNVAAFDSVAGAGLHEFSSL